jgi:hypothetical protein
MLKRFLPLFTAIAALTFIGSGCQLSDLTSLIAESPKPSPLAALSPGEAARRIQFLPGDSFEIRQTFFGFGAFLPDLTKTPAGVRLVSIDHFAPMHFAELHWSLATEGTENKVNTTGTVLGIELKTTHTISPPAYWTGGQFDLLQQKSAIWLSEDAFAELSRTGKTTLNFDVVGEAASQIVKNVTELNIALAKLRNQATAEEQHKDLNLLEADAQPVEAPLKVNGSEVKVSVIKARNWFGEIEVLNNPQNPLIVKMTLNPASASAVNLTQGLSALKNVFGYEVTNLIISNQ